MMRVKRANVAVQIPVFTAITARSCKMCAILADGNSLSDTFLVRQKAMVAHAAKLVAVRSRRTNNVAKIAIRISTPAGTEKHMVVRICP